MRLPSFQVDEALKIVGDYADVVRSTTDQQEQDTVRVAYAIESLYQNKDVWVAEWLEQKPIAKRSGAGRPVQPDSRNRFAQWLNWRLENEGRNTVDGSRVYQLKDCAEIAALIPDDLIISTAVEIINERQLRPLRWLKRYEYTDRVPEIVARAVEIGNGKLTGNITRQALNEWKLEHLGGPKPATNAGKKRRADAIEKARKARLDLERRFDSFVFDAIHGDDGTRDELRALLTHIKTVMREAKNG